MSLLLNVPYAEKDEAKKLGARWNPDLKKWYVSYKKDYYKFQKWILNSLDSTYIICDYLYIIEGIHTCFRCKKQTKVICFGVENFFDVVDSSSYNTKNAFDYESGEIHIVSYIEQIPASLLDYLKKRYNYYYDYSKFAEKSYYANHCQNCSVLQGNNYLFSETNTPFFISGSAKASKLTLYRIKLNYDIQADIEIEWGDHDYLIKQCAQIHDLDNMDLSI